jgi:hypothetical protein
MHRLRLTLALVPLGGLLAACSDANPPSPVPGSPTPLSLAPQTMVLRPNQLQGYVRTDDSTVDAPKLAEQEGDQTLVKTLGDEGLQVGARATYADPNNGGRPTPFATVISQVLYFHDALGAGHFVSDEQTRRSKAPPGGTLTPLSLPLGSADTIVGLAADVPAQNAGDPPARALFAIIRRGNVVAELLGGGTAATATDANFAVLVALQEQQLTAKATS